ncbi:MAG: YihY/virulence factor BrkB family protein [Alphaproteobacteria bacterium]
MLTVLRDAFRYWISSSPFTYSAAAAYYAVFSLPGMLIITISITTFFLDEEVVRLHIEEYAGRFIGPEVAAVIQKIIDEGRLNNSGFGTLVVGGGILLFGATGFFAQLKNTFNVVWGVRPKPEKYVLRFLAYRGISLLVAVSFSFFVLSLIYLSAAFRAYGGWLIAQFPDVMFLRALELSTSFISVAFLFTFILKLLPDVKLRLRYAFIGGTVSSFLYVLGGFVFSSVLGVIAPQSVFGAAGSIILLMIWVTYVCTILQFGAAIMKAFVERRDDEIKISRFVRIGAKQER